MTCDLCGAESPCPTCRRPLSDAEACVVCGEPATHLCDHVIGIVTPAERAHAHGWERLPDGTWYSRRAGHGRHIRVWPIAAGGWRAEHDDSRHDTEDGALTASLDHDDREAP